jgi:hypothetical protein
MESSPQKRSCQISSVYTPQVSQRKYVSVYSSPMTLPDIEAAID